MRRYKVDIGILTLTLPDAWTMYMMYGSLTDVELGVYILHLYFYIHPAKFYAFSATFLSILWRITSFMSSTSECSREIILSKMCFFNYKSELMGKVKRRFLFSQQGLIWLILHFLLNLDSRESVQKELYSGNNNYEPFIGTWNSPLVTAACSLKAWHFICVFREQLVLNETVGGFSVSLIVLQPACR